MEQETLETVITVVCCVCKKQLGTKPGLGQTGISHGYCKPCLNDQKRRLREMGLIK